MLVIKFQSTPLREGRRSRSTPCNNFQPVSIHAPARGATIAARYEIDDSRVSIHAPARGATSDIRFTLQGYQEFQSTPLREGRPGGRGRFDAADESFQSTPLRQGRRAIVVICTAGGRFQSTPLREGRRAAAGQIRTRIAVSIHAPARGATRRRKLTSRSCQGFNPRPCARGDRTGSGTWARLASFQSTPLREGRPRSWSRICGRGLFQSTPLREGRLTELERQFDANGVSIHAPARGATLARA